MALTDEDRKVLKEQREKARRDYQVCLDSIYHGITQRTLTRESRGQDFMDYLERDDSLSEVTNFTKSSAVKVFRPYWQKDGVECSQILIFQEKHGTRYFDGTTDKARYAAALYILKQRFEEGWWYGEEEKVPSLEGTIDDTGLTIQQIEDLPDGKIKKEALEAVKSLKRSIRYAKEHNYQLKLIKKALDESNGRLAYSVLRDRSDHEYERMEVELLGVPK